MFAMTISGLVISLLGFIVHFVITLSACGCIGGDRSAASRESYGTF